jgi:hypothetical protein
LWLLADLGWTRFIVPTPEKTGEMFFAALQAHDYAEAHALLDEGRQKEYDISQLRTFTGAAADEYGEIGDPHGVSSRVDGTQAVAQVELIQPGGNHLLVPIELQQEMGIWKITSVNAYLEQLANGR